MPSYNLITPFLPNKEEHKISERPVLQIVTPERTPEGTPEGTSPAIATESKDPGFDWKQWDGPGWHSRPQLDGDNKCDRDIKAASSSQWPTPMDLPSPISDNLSPLPDCPKCGLTIRQHEMMKAYICGHLCRDIPNENVCPDIDALDLGSKDCPIPETGTSHRTRRRSSLSKSPMVARDESTYEDVDEEKKSTDAAISPAKSHAREGKESPGSTNSFRHDCTESTEKPMYHVCCNASGDADWRKHCRVEKAMKQMLFGDAKVSTSTALEHTQRLRSSEQNLTRPEEAMSSTRDSTKDLDGDPTRCAVAAADSAADNQTSVCEK